MHAVAQSSVAHTRWMIEILGLPLAEFDEKYNNFLTWIGDGVPLCRLILALVSDSTN
jgi:hypothetical protein